MRSALYVMHSNVRISKFKVYGELIQMIIVTVVSTYKLGSKGVREVLLTDRSINTLSMLHKELVHLYFMTV